MKKKTSSIGSRLGMSLTLVAALCVACGGASKKVESPGGSPEVSSDGSFAASNKDIVLKAMTELFVERDVSAIDRYWGNPYTQHNPGIPNGHEVLAGIVKGLGADFKYEPGMVVGDKDIVMIHGRYTGWGPKPMLAVDIFLVKDGKLVEHWDVMQEEVPAAATKSGNPMFTNPRH